MKSPNELKDIWLKVKEIYQETRETTPKITADRIVDELGLDDAVEVFATVANIKKHDGRIYGSNREFTDRVSTNPDACEWRLENPMIRAGLDDIHTAHINQIITELRKMKEVS